MTSTATTTATTTPTGERADLLAGLDHARHFLRFTARNLTDEQAASTPTASVLSIGGLINHVTEVEAAWTDFLVHGASAMEPRKSFEEWTEEDFAARERSFQLLVPDESLADVLEAHEAQAQRTDERAAALPSLDVQIPLPKAPWFTEESWSARRVILHIIAETAQHAGHADIVRETIDGQKSMG